MTQDHSSRTKDLMVGLLTKDCSPVGLQTNFAPRHSKIYTRATGYECDERKANTINSAAHNCKADVILTLQKYRSKRTFKQTRQFLAFL